MNISIDRQNELFAACNTLAQGYDVTTPGVEHGPRVIRAQYKIGTDRRALVHNLNSLKSSLERWQQVTKGIFDECFPNAGDGATIKQSDDPEGFAKYRTLIKELGEKEDELELLPLSAGVVYGDNDMPIEAVAVFARLGLVKE